jgi:hypothetical protein
LRVPINEAGSILVLELGAMVRESIEMRGESVAALRLEPRLMRRIERRRPPAVTLWLSDDRRRIPLRAIVEAGFGRARAELREYRP